MKRKEIYWILGTILLSVIVIFLLLGIDGFIKPDSTLDINIHDTYYVLANVHFSALILILVFFLVYLVRAIKEGFKNLIVNVIIMVATILLILILTALNSMLESIVFRHFGWTVYPPLSNIEGFSKIEEDLKKQENIFDMLSNITFIAQILLLLLLAYSGFKTGINYRETK